MKATLTVTPQFHLVAAWGDRLSVADGAGWRAPNAEELAELVGDPSTAEDLASCVCLFSIPAHLYRASWAMLEQQASSNNGDFVGFATEVARFLAFKELPPPEGAVFELVVRTGGVFDGSTLWGVVNLGDEDTAIAWPGCRLRLRPSEGCRLPADLQLDELEPLEEGPAVFLVIRWAAVPATQSGNFRAN